MRVYLCFSVLFLRVFYLCAAKAVDLGLFYHGQTSTLSPSALIECTPANCSQHVDCNWKYCPVTGHVPKCVEGNYSNKCCTCADEWPTVLSMMMSSTCSNLQPLRFKKGYYDNLGGQPTKKCHQLFKHDIHGKSNQLKRLYEKISKNRINNMFTKRKTNLEFGMNRLRKKKLLLYQIRKMYDILSKNKSSYGDATEDNSNDDFSSTTETSFPKSIDDNVITGSDSNVLKTNSNHKIKYYISHVSSDDTRNPKRNTGPMIKHTDKGNISNNDGVMHSANYKYDEFNAESEEKQENTTDSDKPKESISINDEPKVIMGDKLVPRINN